MLRKAIEVVAIAAISVVVAWWWLLPALGVAHPTRSQVMAAAVYQLYWPTSAVVEYVIGVTGGLPKHFWLLIFPIVATVQNVAMWFGARWVVRKLRKGHVKPNNVLEADEMRQSPSAPAAAAQHDR